MRSALNSFIDTSSEFFHLSTWHHAFLKYIKVSQVYISLHENSGKQISVWERHILQKPDDILGRQSPSGNMIPFSRANATASLVVANGPEEIG